MQVAPLRVTGFSLLDLRRKPLLPSYCRMFRLCIDDEHSKPLEVLMPSGIGILFASFALPVSLWRVRTLAVPLRAAVSKGGT